MKLYNYFRSSASYRVRIVAGLKGLSPEYASINLTRGESRTPAYEALNPQGRVPALEDNGRMLTQSLAICEYLEETHPNPPLLPRDPAGRARVRAIALAVACEIHPIGGGRAQAYLGRVLKASEDQRAEWGRHYHRGLSRDRSDAHEFAGDGPLLSWRYADAGRRFPGAAGVQRRTIRGGHDALPDHSSNLPGVRQARDVRPRPA